MNRKTVLFLFGFMLFFSFSSTLKSQSRELYSHLSGLNVRVDPHSGARSVTRIEEGQKVIWEGQISKNTDTISLRGVRYIEPWLKIKTDRGLKGWVFGGALKFYAPGKESSPAGIPLFSNVDHLRVRSEPGTGGKVLYELAEGEQVAFAGSATLKKDRYSMRGVYYDEPWVLIDLPGGRQGWVYAGGLKIYPTTENPVQNTQQPPGPGAYPWQDIQTRCRYQEISWFKLDAKFSMDPWRPYSMTFAEKQRFLSPLEEADEFIVVSEDQENYPVFWHSWQGWHDGFVYATAFYFHMPYASELFLLKMTPEGKTESWWRLGWHEVEIGYLQKQYGKLNGNQFIAIRVEEVCEEAGNFFECKQDSTTLHQTLLPDGDIQITHQESHSTTYQK